MNRFISFSESSRGGEPVHLLGEPVHLPRKAKNLKFGLFYSPYSTPTADFHDYQISWNQHQIVFYVDGVPVRVHKNVGVGFPTQPMQIEASLWDGESWATDGGKTKTDWSKAPFKAHFQGFDMAGCPAQPGPNTPWSCYSNDFWWNQQQFWQLNDEQQRAYQNVKQYYTDYNYCGDRARYPTPPPECN